MFLAHADLKRVIDLLGLFTLGLWSVTVLWVRCEPTGLRGPAIPGAHFLNVIMLSGHSLMMPAQSLWAPLLRFLSGTVLLGMVMSLRVSETWAAYIFAPWKARVYLACGYHPNQAHEPWVLSSLLILLGLFGFEPMTLLNLFWMWVLSVWTTIFSETCMVPGTIMNLCVRICHQTSQWVQSLSLCPGLTPKLSQT